MSNKQIQSPEFNTVVRHKGFGKEDDPNYPCNVLIVSGTFYTDNSRVSNYWSWRRVFKNGRVSKVESGYGSFEETTKRYRVYTDINVREES